MLVLMKVVEKVMMGFWCWYDVIRMVLMLLCL